MKSLCFALAVDMSELREFQRASPAKTSFGLVLTAISAVVAVIVIWAVFFRKRRDETMLRYREHFSSANAKEKPFPAPPEASAPGSSSSAPNSGARSRRKRRRRDHAQRNPTLAEKGGLPPVRDEWPSDDPP